MNRPAMVRVHSCLSGFEAHLFRTALAQHGITAEVRNEMLAPLAGALPMTEVMAEVWVPQGDAPEAERVLSEVLGPRQEEGRVSLAETEGGELSEAHEGALSSPDARVCPECGEESPPEFGECWNCQRPL